MDVSGSLPDEGPWGFTPGFHADKPTAISVSNNRGDNSESCILPCQQLLGNSDIGTRFHVSSSSNSLWPGPNVYSPFTSVGHLPFRGAKSVPQRQTNERGELGRDIQVRIRKLIGLSVQIANPDEH